MKAIYPNSIFQKDFDFIRRRTITDHITSDLAYYTSRNNRIAQTIKCTLCQGHNKKRLSCFKEMIPVLYRGHFV